MLLLLLTKRTPLRYATLPLGPRGAILGTMKRGIALASCVAVLAGLLLSAAAARADEIKLKDGSKIIGTIVGFEDNSFKVKTSYGFAVVQKDQVVSIIVTDSAKKPEPNAPKTSAAPTPASTTATPPNSPSAKTETPERAVAAPPRSSATDSASNDVVEYPHTDVPPSSTNNAPSSAPAKIPPQRKVTPVAAPPPPKPAAPEPMREEVTGNTYTNDTYGFRMYKPPDWHVIAGASKILPGAITAMGTDDQTTYLMIGQETGGKSLTNVMDAADKRLHDVMDNFRPLDEKRVTISGVTAIERKFRGSVDDHDWSGVAVYIPRGAGVYTIFGMTLASTDLVQIQENVISRAITSLQFTK